ERANVGFKNMANRADAEGVRLADLARINDKGLLRQTTVKLLKAEPGIGWKMERGDDVALDLWLEIDLKTKPFHSLHQCPVIGHISSSPGGDAALQLQFAQSLRKGEDRVRRRCVSELAVFLEPFP